MREDKKKQKIAENERRQEEHMKQKLEAQQHKKQATVDSSGSRCFQSTCDHTKARNWVMCSECELWFHCVCVKVPTKVLSDKGCLPLSIVFGKF